MTKSRIAAIIIALLLVGGYFLWSGRGSDATWFDDSYAYRKKITIGNSGSAISSARKVLVEVDTATLTTDKMQADCDDTRFTDINGKLLRFYIDTGAGACDTSSTDYYVELTSVTTGDNIIYMYYGNPSASSGQARGSEFTLDLQPDATAGIDTKVSNQSSADGTHGTETTMSVALYNNGTPGRDNDLIKFDLSSIPTTATVTNVEFIPTWSSLPAGSSHRVGIYRVLPADTWSEGSSWNYATPSTVRWAGDTDLNGGTDAGCNVSGTDYDATSMVSTVTPTLGAQVITFDANGIADVQSWVDGSAANRGLLLKSLTTDFIGGPSLYTSDYSVAASRPRFVVEYSVAGDITAATFTPTSGPTLASEEKTPGLVAYWRFDDGQGSTAQDSTVNNLDGTLGTGSSAPTWTEESRCVSGKCLQFDGTDDVVTAADSNNTSLTGNFTLSAWVKRSVTGVQHSIIEKYQTGDINGYLMRIQSNDKILVGILSGSSAATNSSTATLSANTWYHLTYVFDDTNNLDKIYINGVLDSSQSQSLSPADGNTTLKIGARGNDAGTHMNGFIDEVKIYPYARTAAQIQADFAKASSAKGGGVLGAADTSKFTNGLVGHWKIDESSWTNDCSTGTILDYSGNSNHGKACPSSTGPTGGATGKFSYGGTTDGTDDYIKMSIPTLTTYSIAFWVKHVSGTGIIFEDVEASDPSLEAGTEFWIGNSSNISAGGLTTGEWTHIVAVYSDSGDFQAIYKNGALVSSRTTTISSTLSGTMFWGARSPGTSVFRGMTLDDIRIYNRILSAGDVKDLYNAEFAPGPVMHLKIDEKTGTSVSDISGNANTGTLGTGSSAPSWTTGKYGSALSYDGGDKVTVANASSLQITGPITVEAWIRTSTSQSNTGIVSKWQNAGDSSTSYVLNISHITANKPLFGINNGSTIVAEGTTSVNTGAWYHLAGVYDGATVRIYVNGVQEGSTAATGSITSGTSQVWVGSYAGSLGFTGLVDDAKIYNYARTQKQIVEDMNAGHPAGGSPVGSAVSYWKFDEGQGTSANDNSLNSNTLTLSTATSAWTNSGKFGKAWDGNGSRYVSRADDVDFDFTATEDFAISGWVKSDSASNPGAIEHVVNKANATTAGYAVYFNTSGFLCFGIDDDTTWGPDIASCTSADYYDAGWHHFSAVRDTVSDTTRIYVDGLSRDSDSDTTSATLANSLLFYVGDRDGTDNGDEFTGDVDEVKIYRSALASSEVLIDYNRGASIVLGALSDNSTYEKSAANQEYCVPGDSTSCAAPVGEWKMDEGSWTNNCSTDSVFDTSGNGNNGDACPNATGPTGGATGKIGKAGSFDGSDDYVNVGSATSIDLNSNFTVSFWAKAANISDNLIQYGVAKMGTGVGWGVGIIGTSGGYCSGVDGTINVYDRDSDNTVCGSTVMNTTSWYHITFTNDGTTTKLYVNGILENSGAQTFASSDAANLYLGSRADTAGLEWNGSLDHVRIYNYVRSAAQVAWDYNRGAPVARWKLDECQGSTAYDASGNGLNGTITIGASGETLVGDCTTSSTAWGDGATGKFNSSLSFDGTDDYIGVTSIAGDELDLSTKMTVGTWFNFTTIHDGNNYLFSRRDSSTGYGYSLYVNNTSDTLRAFISTSAGNCGDNTLESPILSGSTWYHGMFTYDGANMRLYLNGKEVDSVACTVSSPSQTVNAYIGVYNSLAATFMWPGQIDDVQIFNYALSAAQVRNVYNGGAAVNYGPSTGAP